MFAIDYRGFGKSDGDLPSEETVYADIANARAALLSAKTPSDKIAANGVAIATWPDWWGFKYEAWDGIPWNAAISAHNGVRVALKSDSEDVTRRLNQDAGKIMRYGLTEEEALKSITLNPAWIMGIEDRVGSIDVGKDADIAIWNSYPLSSTALADKVLIDGDVYFDRSLPGLGLTHYKGRGWRFITMPPCVLRLMGSS